MAVISHVFTSFLEVVDRVIKGEIKCCILDLGFILRQGLWQFCFYPLKVSESVLVSLQTYVDRMEGELNSTSSWWGFLCGALDVWLRQNAGWPLGRAVDQNSGMGLSLVQPCPDLDCQAGVAYQRGRKLEEWKWSIGTCLNWIFSSWIK